MEMRLCLACGRHPRPRERSFRGSRPGITTLFGAVDQLAQSIRENPVPPISGCPSYSLPQGRNKTLTAASPLRPCGKQGAEKEAQCFAALMECLKQHLRTIDVVNMWPIRMID